MNKYFMLDPDQGCLDVYVSYLTKDIEQQLYTLFDLVRDDYDNEIEEIVIDGVITKIEFISMGEVHGFAIEEFMFANGYVDFYS